MRGKVRSPAPTLALLWGMIKLIIPLLIIAGASLWILKYQGTRTGSLEVSTTVPGADIYIGGIQTTATSDTVIEDVPIGKQFISVRLPGYIPEPEVAIVEIEEGGTACADFRMRPRSEVVAVDSIPPARPVRQEIFSTGQPIVSVPAVTPRQERRIVDYAPKAADIYTGQELESSPDLSMSDSALYEPLSDEIKSLQGTEISVTSIPEGADIIVNGAPTPRVTPYTFRGLDRGFYKFQIRLDGYIAKPESISVALVRDYQSELLSYELTPDRKLPTPTVSIETRPLASGFYFDGRSAGVGKAVVECEFGKHYIEFADVPGYSTPDPVDIELTHNNPNAEIVGEYIRLEGDAYLALSPSDDIRNFDGKKLRVFIDNELIIDKPEEEFDVTLVENVLSGRRLLRVEYDDLTQSLHLDMLDGEVIDVTLRVESFFSKKRLSLRAKTTTPLDKWQRKTRKQSVLSFG